MGHYRSEMGYEDEDRKTKERLEIQHRRTKSAIEDDIRKRGVSAVLTDIVLDLQGYRLRVY